jgi:hypothetical protein
MFCGLAGLLHQVSFWGYNNSLEYCLPDLEMAFGTWKKISRVGKVFVHVCK